MEHQKLASRMIASDDGGTGLLHKMTKPTAWRGGVQILKEEEEDVNRSRVRWPSSQSSAGFDQRNKRRSGGILGEGGAVWEMTATSLHNDVLLYPE